MKLRLLLVIIALAVSLNANSASPQDNFKAHVTLSSESIAITDQLTIHVLLTYPTTYHPNIDQIKGTMLAYNGLNEPPFYLVNSTVKPAVEKDGIASQEITFTVAAQMPGKHFLSLQMIRFDPNSKGAPVEVPTNVFEVEVSVPKNTFDMEAALAPPMSFTTILPISISVENQREFQNNKILNTIEGGHIIDALQKRIIPWTFFVSAVAVLITIILIRASRDSLHEIKEDPLLAERLRRLSLEELQNLVANQPGKDESPNTYFLRLDGALRKYLDTTYHLGASTSTAQELVRKTDALPGVDEQVRKQIGMIFLKSDQIKFGKINTTESDTKAATAAVSKLVQK